MQPQKHYSHVHSPIDQKSTCLLRILHLTPLCYLILLAISWHIILLNHHLPPINKPHAEPCDLIQPNYLLHPTAIYDHVYSLGTRKARSGVRSAEKNRCRPRFHNIHAHTQHTYSLVQSSQQHNHSLGESKPEKWTPKICYATRRLGPKSSSPRSCCVTRWLGPKSSSPRSNRAPKSYCVTGSWGCKKWTPKRSIRKAAETARSELREGRSKKLLRLQEANSKKVNPKSFFVTRSWSRKNIFVCSRSE